MLKKINSSSRRSTRAGSAGRFGGTLRFAHSKQNPVKLNENPEGESRVGRDACAGGSRKRQRLSRLEINPRRESVPPPAKAERPNATPGAGKELPPPLHPEPHLPATHRPLQRRAMRPIAVDPQPWPPARPCDVPAA